MINKWSKICAEIKQQASAELAENGQTLPDVGVEVIPVARVLDTIIAALPGGLRQSLGEDDDEDIEVN